MYKILVNSQMKMTNIEFTCYVKSIMRKISSKYIIENVLTLKMIFKD